MWTHISVQSEVSFSSILPCDDTMTTVHTSDHGSLKLLRCYNLNRHDWLQDGCVCLLHGWCEEIKFQCWCTSSYKKCEWESWFFLLPCLRAPSPARMKEYSLESTMWFAPSSRMNLTPEILCPLRGPFSQASMNPCSIMGRISYDMVQYWYRVALWEDVQWSQEHKPFLQLVQTALGHWSQQSGLQTPVWCNALVQEVQGLR